MGVFVVAFIVLWGNTNIFTTIIGRLGKPDVARSEKEALTT
jgi:hypothetical protein